MSTEIFCKNPYEVPPYDILACLEFLANDASSKNRLHICNILRRSIEEINALNTSEYKDYTVFDYSDILIAFRLFTKFCLLNDPSTKQELIDYIGIMDSDVLKNYTN